MDDFPPLDWHMGSLNDPVVLVWPTTHGWQPRHFVGDILDIQRRDIANGRSGPWVLCVSSAWRPYMKLVYAVCRGKLTLLDRILEVEGILAVAFYPKLRGYDVALCQVGTTGISGL